MPTRPQRPCPVPGCPVLTNGGPCPTHRTERNRATDRVRGSAHARGYGRDHAARRRSVLERDPLCVACLAEGHIVASSVYDHIVPIEAGGSVTDLANAQGLCARCHNRKRQAEGRGRQLRVQQGAGLVDVGPLSRVA